MVYFPGAFDSSHLYVQWGGKLPGGEQWSCGLRMAKKSAGAISDGTALLANASAAIAQFHGDADSFISEHAKLSFVKVNAIGVDGKYIGDDTVEATFADVPGAWANVPRYPNQVAWCISLLTGFSRGAAHRGRFYLPLPMAALGTDGRVLESNADAMKGNANELVANLNAINADYEVAVFSRKQGAATHRKVTETGVGRVLDTQRRRRASLVEAYS